MDLPTLAVLLLGLLLVVIVVAAVRAGGGLGVFRGHAAQAKVTEPAENPGTGASTPTPRVLGLDPAEPSRRSALLSALLLRRVRWGLAGGVLAVGTLLVAGISLLSGGGRAEGPASARWEYQPPAERTGPAQSRVSRVGVSSRSAEPEMAVDPLGGTRLIAWSGSGQRGDPGRLLRGGLAVVLQDSAGRPIPGAEVRFIVAGGGGRVEPSTATTTDLGLAVTTWWLGENPDSLRVTARMVSPPELSVEFTAAHRDELEVSPLVVAEGGGQNGPGSGEPENLVAVAPETPLAEGTEVTTPEAAEEPAPARAPATAPAPVAPALGRVASRTRPAFAAGGIHTCRLLGGEVLCWGGDDRESVGRAMNGGPASAPALRVVSAGLFHSCGVTTRETVYCWPAGGSASHDHAASPVEVDLPDGAVPVDVVAGAEHSCVLTADGGVFCWGANTHGQLGNGTTSDARSPVRVEGLAGVIQLASGWMHTCALTRAGRVYCWGSNSGGQVGDSGPGARTRPTLVEQTATIAVITAGSAHSCALTESGRIWCWGSNEHGQLGTGTTASGRGPQPVVGNLVFRTVAAGGVHTCGLAVDGTAWCWGRNTFGQLGNESDRDADRPSPVAGGRQLVALDAGGSHTCGETRDGRVYCWGNNIQGQVGDGTRDNRSAPVAVARED